MSNMANSGNYSDQLKQALTALRELRTRLQTLEEERKEPMAIIGMACRFPGNAHTPDAFWRLLQAGGEGIIEVPADRWDSDAYYDPEPGVPGKMYTRRGGFLPTAALFDARFFEISPREARRTDPQQRLLLEVSWEALERAGQNVQALAGSNTGIFVGVTSNHYTDRQVKAEGVTCIDDPYYLFGSACSVAAGRLAYQFDFRGPTFAVDTACSSSLVALHLACQSLRNQECNLAVAGGVHLIMTPETIINYCKMNMLAADGRCKTFDALADGFGLSEGCGVVVLKRLSEALAAGDTILAVVRGSAINEDGRSNGLTAPNGLAQQAVIRQALANAQVEPHQISYVEAHGSGTALGDPIEIESLQTVLGANRPASQPLWVGSVKSNIGHLSTASGMAGLIKTILSLQHQTIPAHLHCQTPNPHINWDEQLQVSRQSLPWQPVAGKRLAGVSSFGWAGTNAHLILEEAPSHISEDSTRPYQLLPLSAQTPDALGMAAANLAEYLRQNPVAPLADVAYTLQVGRAAFAHRRVLVCRNHEEAIGALTAREPNRLLSGKRPSTAHNMTFMFAGVGDHYVNMGRGLYEHEPVFRQTVEACCAQLAPLLKVDLRQIIYPEPGEQVAPAKMSLKQMLGREETSIGPETALDQTALAQPATFVINWALAQLLRAWGIHPQAVVGHSLGEYTAACMAGVLSLEDSLNLVARRAQMIQQLPEGRMLAVPLSEKEVQPFLDEEVCLAVVNNPTTCVLAGPPGRLETVAARLAANGVACRFLATSHAFHSTMMQPIVPELTAVIQSLTLKPPQIPYLSLVTGQWITEEEATDPTYWGRHLVQTVRFGSGLDLLLQEEHHTLLEIGPGQSLGSFVRQHPRCQKQQWPHVLATLPYAHDPRSDTAVLLETVGKLWLADHAIHWAHMHQPESRRRIPLPTYPFIQERYWIDHAEDTPPAASAIKERTAAGKKADSANWFYKPVWEPTALAAKQAAAAGVWLLFLDERGVGHDLAAQLVDAGATAVQVHVGQTFAQTGAHTFVIRPDAPADYEALMAALQQAEQIPNHLVHLWGLNTVNDNDASSEKFQAAQCQGFYSLLYLAQTVQHTKSAQPLLISVVTDRAQPVGDEPAFPEQTTMWGAALVISQEFQQFRCRLVDIAVPAAPDHSLAQVSRMLLSELTSPISDLLVAHREDKRYVQRFIPQRLPVPVVPPLRRRGVYWITGGLGAVGLSLAAYLAQQVQARLVLTSRSGLPSRMEWAQWLADHPESDPVRRKIEAVQQLEAQGAEVLVLAANVADEGQMKAAMAHIASHFGVLHGVIHAAGVVNWDVFQHIHQVEAAVCEVHFQAKAHGLYVLEKVLQDQNELDFCLLFSSLSAVLGGIGFAAYAAANRFMDAYVLAYHRQPPHKWISVDWDLWDVGQTKQEADHIRGTSLAQYAMTVAEGGEALLRVLGSRLPQLVHSTGDLPARLRQWVQREAIKAPPVLPASAPSLTPISVSQIEKKIAAIWQEALGITQMGVHENFFDLGGNSLIALQVIQQLQQAFAVSLSTVALFEAPTVSALAKYLQPEAAQAGDQPELGWLANRRRQVRQHVENQDIAIVSMNGRFPGAKNVDQFWQNLCQGIDSLTHFPDEELLAAGVSPPLLSDPHYVKARHILEDVDLFDAQFFDYSPREAELLDPQHRLFMECAWEVIEMAGYDPMQYPGLIGVFAGSSLSTYLLSWLNDPEITTSMNGLQALVSSEKDSLTTTASYKLNLCGPSLAVQTFCSTSLVATHLACQSLLRGECDMALAGGVTVLTPPTQGYLYQPGSIVPADGHCRTFDARGQGAPFGDGVGVVLLKRLEDAIADGDMIQAVIKGSAINNDGSLKAGYTAPSVAGQSQAIQMALENAGVDPETIGYVEAHGTATELGDPIEVASLTQAYRRYTARKAYCAIGSAKTNIGHLDRAAGITGLIKTALVLKEGVIPPSLHYDTPNPEINFGDSPFYVNTHLSPWREDGAVRRAAVNSLGVGGTNAHLVLQEPPLRPDSGASRPWQLLLLSSRTEMALDIATANLAQYIRTHPETPLADMVYTLQVGRRRFEHRRMVVVRDMAEALQTMESVDPKRVLTLYQPDTHRRVAFLFPGVGDHYVQMARELYEQEAVFHAVVEQCCQILRPYLGQKIRDLLYPAVKAAAMEHKNGVNLRAMLKGEKQPVPAEAKWLRETHIAQPVLFVIEYALARLLMTWGIQPQAMAGYSLGEYVAACLAGVFSLADALTLVAKRAAMIAKLPVGRMLAVSLSKTEVQAYLSESVSLAVHQGEQLCVLAGSPAAIDALQSQLTQQGVACRPLETTHAFHSPMMAPAAASFAELVKAVPLSAPHTPYVSNVTGDWITPAEATDPHYWVRHMCQPVQFFDTLATLLAQADQILLEVGPGQSLGAFAKVHPACCPEQLSMILPTVRYTYDQQSDLAFLFNTLGRLWMLGIEMNWASFYQAEQRQRVLLPTYPFQRQRYWINSSRKYFLGATTLVQSEAPKQQTPPQEWVRRETADWFYVPGWRQTAPHVPALPVSGAGDCWLLFADEQGLSSRVAAWLAENQQQVVFVHRGAAFTAVDSTHYTIRPSERTDYDRLLTALQHHSLQPTRIAHFWCVTPEHDLKEVLDLGLYSLVCLVQSLAEHNLAACELSILASQSQAVIESEETHPEKATLWGPCRVIPQEFVGVACRIIDVNFEPANRPAVDTLVSHVIGELTTKVEETVVALRGSQRWVESFAPVQLSPQAQGAALPIRPNGVYLITGGLGGIGLAVAEHLARTARARLVLVGRSGLPERETWPEILAAENDETGLQQKLRQVQKLESLTDGVLILAADVANKAQMKTAVEQAVAVFGTVHGVIHAAGVPGVGLLQLKTVDMLNQVLAPKVQGTLILEQVLEEAAVDLDVFVLFSSIASIVGGGPGQTDYCAANAFMDAYARRRAGEKRLTASINWCEWQWDAWSEGLTAFDSEIQQVLKENRQKYGLTFAEGNEALERILSRRLPQTVVCTQELNSLIEFSQTFTMSRIIAGAAKEAPAGRSQHPRPLLMTPYAAPTSEIEEAMVQIWENLLGISPIGIHDHFLELGGHSLMAIQVIWQLRQLFEINLPLSTLLSSPTIEALAVVVELALIEELAEMSEEQVADLIQEL